MRLKILHITILLIISFSFSSFSQEKVIKGYKIDGDTIIFTFDKRDYETATNDKNQQKVDFVDFDIKNVVVSGNFNNWSRKKWKMNKIDENIYQLKKRIKDFDDNYNYEFKFIVNNALWAEPSENFTNIAPANTWFGKRLDTYNLKILPAYISKNGNAQFYLEGYENAKEVILSGSFNKWDEQLYKMIKTENGWELNLKLSPNTYYYKFIVDGNWMEDPINRNKVKNEYNGFNSVLKIKKEVTFLVNDFKDANEVILAGSFNNWSKNAYQMKKTINGWIYRTKLTGGKHHYKFIVDGEWKLDPNNSIKEYDGKGHINSVKMVK